MLDCSTTDSPVELLEDRSIELRILRQCIVENVSQLVNLTGNRHFLRVSHGGRIVRHILLIVRFIRRSGCVMDGSLGAE